MPCRDFRFRHGGMGANPTFKSNKSNELGEAFCRWFLDKALNIPYVASISAVRGHGALKAYGGISVKSKKDITGDGPDFFCVDQNGSVYLAEAKGTKHAVGFGTKEFQRWRKQFDRVSVLDAAGNPLSVKGYIVAMRWASENDQPNIFTKLAAEDPQTPGDRPFFDEQGGFSAAVRSLHYVGTLKKLRQPILAASLEYGAIIPEELRFRVTLWKSFLPQLKDHLFVGGYFPTEPHGVLPYNLENGEIIMTSHNPLRLDINTGVFVGVEKKIFSALVDTARNGPRTINNLPLLDRIDSGYSGASVLCDGHALGPIELFYPIGTIVL